MRKVIAGFLVSGLFVLVNADLTPYSGPLLKRPILFVHGVNADMGSWGARPAHAYCVNPVATFSKVLYEYIPIQGLHMDNTPFDGSKLPIWNASSKTGEPMIPAPVSKAAGQVWRDLPAGYGYFQMSGTTGGSVPLPKTGAGQSTAALPPTWAFANATNTTIIQVIVGYEYIVSCADGSKHVQRSGFPPGTNSAGALASHAKSSLELIWTDMPYAIAPKAWSNGYVESYKAQSGLQKLAARYHVDTSMSPLSDNSYMTNINHNGLELYTSTTPDGSTTDAFCRPDLTVGVVHNSILAKDEIGQTNQLLDRMAQVLTEYYPDWKTNSSAQIDVVCHSQGCLVTRNVVRTQRATGWDNPVNHLHAIVALNSPELGTAMATDQSGVPAISEIRSTVYGIYKSGLLDPIHIKIPLGPVDFNILEYDPFSAVREMAMNFTNTDQYLAYPDNYPTTNWEPPTSNIAVASGLCVSPTVSYTKTTPISDDASRTPYNTKRLKYEYAVTCQDGHKETAYQYVVDYSNATTPTKPSTAPPSAFLTDIQSTYSGSAYGPYGLRSQFVTDLKNANPAFPTRPATGVKIPFTSYWGTAPGLGGAYLNLAHTAAQNTCKDITKWEVKATEVGVLGSLLFPVLAPLLIPIASTAGTDAVMPMGTCDVTVLVLFNELNWMVQSLDANWSQYSDFVVDKSSQQIKGLFKSSDPYLVRTYDLSGGELGVPHMDFPLVGVGGNTLYGACARSDDYYKAIENPPTAMGFLPSIFELLQ